MKNRAFCFASLVLVALALCVHFLSMHQLSKANGLRADSVYAASDQKQPMRADAQRCGVRALVFFVSGVFLAISSLFFLVRSFRRHETAWWRSVPVALLVFYLMLQFTLE